MTGIIVGFVIGVAVWILLSFTAAWLIARWSTRKGK